MLNRCLELTSDALIYKAHPRHVDLLSDAFGLSQSNGESTPGVKEPDGDGEAPKDSGQPCTEFWASNNATDNDGATMHDGNKRLLEPKGRMAWRSCKMIRCCASI